MVIAQVPKITTQEILERALHIKEEVAKVALETEERGSVSESVMNMLCESGIFSVLSPSEFGGQEMSLDVVLDFCDHVGQGCVSTAWLTSLVTIHNWMVGLFPYKGQKEVFGNDNYKVVSATFSPKGKAVKTENGYFISGKWPFLTGIKYASWVIVGAMYSPASNNKEFIPKVFILPQNQVEILDTWYVSGMKGTGSNDIKINEVFIPEYRVIDLAELLNGNSPGSKVLKSTNFKWSAAPVVVFTGTAPAIGAAKRVIQIYKDKLKNFLNDKIDVRQTALIRLADVMVRLETVELLVRNGIQDMIIKSKNGAVTIDDRAKYRVSCVLAVKECKLIINDILDVMGSRSYYLSEDIQRYARDIAMIYSHTVFDFDGANEIYGRLQLELPHNSSII